MASRGYTWTAADQAAIAKAEAEGRVAHKHSGPFQDKEGRWHNRYGEFMTEPGSKRSQRTVKVPAEHHPHHMSEEGSEHLSELAESRLRLPNGEFATVAEWDSYFADHPGQEAAWLAKHPEYRSQLRGGYASPRRSRSPTRYSRSRSPSRSRSRSPEREAHKHTGPFIDENGRLRDATGQFMSYSELTPAEAAKLGVSRSASPSRRRSRSPSPSRPAYYFSPATRSKLSKLAEERLREPWGSFATPKEFIKYAEQNPGVFRAYFKKHPERLQEYLEEYPSIRRVASGW